MPSGDVFQWQSKDDLYHSQTAPFFHPGSSPSYLQAHVFVRFIFSVCSRNLICCTQRAVSSVLPLAAKIPSLLCGSFFLLPFPGSYSSWDPSRMDEWLSCFRFHFCIIFSPLGAGALECLPKTKLLSSPDWLPLFVTIYSWAVFLAHCVLLKPNSCSHL